MTTPLIQSAKENRHACHAAIDQAGIALSTAHYKILGKQGLLKFEQVERIDLVVAKLLEAQAAIVVAVDQAMQAKDIMVKRDFDAYKAEKDALEATANAEAEQAETLAVEAAKLFFEDDEDNE